MSVRTRSIRILSTIVLSASCCCDREAVADHPRVKFDIPFTIECRDVTTDNYAKANPEQRLIEAKFRISAKITGNEKDIQKFDYVIDNPHKSLRVISFVPTKELGSDVAGTIKIIESSNLGGEAGVNARGEVVVNVRYGQAKVSKNAQAKVSAERSKSKMYDMIPPKHLVLASGTVNREHGVFFTLKQHSQDSLQGQREFACIFEAHKSWRGDAVVISCLAEGWNRRKFWFPNEVECGIEQTVVGLHLKGDLIAKKAAEVLADVQEKYAEVLREQLLKDKERFYAGMKSGAVNVAIVNSALLSGGATIPFVGAYKAYKYFTADEESEKREKEDSSTKLSDADKAVKKAVKSLTSLSGASRNPKAPVDEGS